MQNLNQEQICSNCTKYFPKDRIDLHQAYCLRNIRKCTFCSQFIDLKQIDIHNEKNHKKKPCSYCMVQIIPEQLINHQNNCLRRPKLCTFCQNNVSFAQFNYHQSICGARTKLCSICNTNILLREFHNGHQLTCKQRKRIPIIKQEKSQNIQQKYTSKPEKREREISTNMGRGQIQKPTVVGRGDRSLSSNRINHKNQLNKEKVQKGFMKIQSTQVLKKIVDILPISVKLTLKNKKQSRQPLRARN